MPNLVEPTATIVVFSFLIFVFVLFLFCDYQPARRRGTQHGICSSNLDSVRRGFGSYTGDARHGLRSNTGH